MQFWRTLPAMCVRSLTTIGCEIKKALVLTTTPTARTTFAALGYPFSRLKTSQTHSDSVVKVKGRVKAELGLSPRRALVLELRGVTCHTGTHSVTCHPTQVNAPRQTHVPFRHNIMEGSFVCLSSPSSAFPAARSRALTLLSASIGPTV